MSQLYTGTDERYFIKLFKVNWSRLFYHKNEGKSVWKTIRLTFDSTTLYKLKKIFASPDDVLLEWEGMVIEHVSTQNIRQGHVSQFNICFGSIVFSLSFSLLAPQSQILSHCFFKYLLATRFWNFLNLFLLWPIINYFEVLINNWGSHISSYDRDIFQECLLKKRQSGPRIHPKFFKFFLQLFDLWQQVLNYWKPLVNKRVLT